MLRMPVPLAIVFPLLLVAALTLAFSVACGSEPAPDPTATSSPCDGDAYIGGDTHRGARG